MNFPNHYSVEGTIFDVEFHIQEFHSKYPDAVIFSISFEEFNYITKIMKMTIHWRVRAETGEAGQHPLSALFSTSPLK